MSATVSAFSASEFSAVSTDAAPDAKVEFQPGLRLQPRLPPAATAPAAPAATAPAAPAATAPAASVAETLLDTDKASVTPVTESAFSLTFPFASSLDDAEDNKKTVGTPPAATLVADSWANDSKESVCPPCDQGLKRQKLCRNGPGCTNKPCPFWHPWEKDCKYNPCTRRGCWYKHPKDKCDRDTRGSRDGNRPRDRYARGSNGPRYRDTRGSNGPRDRYARGSRDGNRPRYETRDAPRDTGRDEPPFQGTPPPPPPEERSSNGDDHKAFQRPPPPSHK